MSHGLRCDIGTSQVSYARHIGYVYDMGYVCDIGYACHIVYMCDMGYVVTLVTSQIGHVCDTGYKVYFNNKYSIFANCFLKSHLFLLNIQDDGQKLLLKIYCHMPVTLILTSLATRNLFGLPYMTIPDLKISSYTIMRTHECTVL